MPLAIPAELKKITPFVRRAEELDKDKSNAESRLVAYYCRQYAVHSGIPLAQSPTSKECLGNILNDLETEKQAMSNFTPEESKYLCSEFANRIFEKADEEDRSGNATKNTAKTFYAAASFLEILHQFYPDGDASEELVEVKKRTKYSKWKATDILKAMKEGREPTPGGYKEYEVEPDDEEAETAPTSNAPPPAASEIPAPPVIPPSAPLPPPVVETVPEEEGQEVPLGGETNLDPPPAYPGPSGVFVPPIPPAPPSAVPRPPIVPTVAPTPPPMPAPKPAKPSGFFGGMRKKNNSSGKTTKEQFADAIELTNFALAALQEKDDDLAAQRLKEALQALGK